MSNETNARRGKYSQYNADWYQKNRDRLRERSKEAYHNDIPGFIGCEDCRTCEKLGCRHNPKNPERLAVVVE